MNILTRMLNNMMCKLFAQSLKGAALRWFCNLPPESIDSFDKLSLEFMRSYSVHIQSGKTTKICGAWFKDRTNRFALTSSVLANPFQRSLDWTTE